MAGGVEKFARPHLAKLIGLTVLLKVLYNVLIMINSVSITELKQNTAGVLGKVKSGKKPIVVFQRSKATAVIVDPEYFERMEQALEDASDLRVIEERKNEPTVPFEDVAKKLGL